jgi:glycosyltransferase involved in cell wall biosynthesis
MSKHIWIINEYAGSLYHGMEFRHYNIAKELVSMGYRVTIISSSYSHLFKKLPENGKQNIDGVDYLWIKTLNYGNSHDKKRVLKWFIFAFKILFLPFVLKEKPNIIIYSPMAPFAILSVLFLSKLNKAKLIYEVKDIWPLSLIELGKISPNNLFIKFMGFFEKIAIKKSDRVVSSLMHYNKHLINLNINKDFVWINNGIDLRVSNKSIEPFKIDNKFKDKFIIGYLGTIGVANALDCFLDSANMVYDIEDILFLIVGDGKEKNRLVKKYNKNNIIFLDSVPKNQVQSVLLSFDICYLGWNKSRLYEFGISANKLFDYMYSKKPILHSFSGDGDIVKIANCGISVEAMSVDSITEAIVEFYQMEKTKRDLLGANGYKYVVDNFSYEKLSNDYRRLF